jgi:release factor glutamine methyltransferase
LSKQYDVFLLKEIRQRLCVSDHVICPEQEARWLLEHFAEQDNCEVLLGRAVQERIKGKPIAYILGYVDFLDLRLKVKEPILIPRVETEEWVGNLINLIKAQVPAQKKLKILDLCAGSGCIALALAKAFPGFEITGSDIDAQAVSLANENKKSLNLKNINFLQTDLFQGLEVFDLIVSNPPYLSDREHSVLDSSVRSWESEKALVATDEGLFFYNQILSRAKQHLISNNFDLPVMICEIGAGQKEALEKIFQKNGFVGVKSQQDLFRRWRVVSGFFVMQN